MNKLPRSFFGITTPVLRSAMHTSRAPAIPFTRYTREHTSALGCRQYLSVVPSVPVIIEPKISSVTKRTFSSESGTKEVFPSVSYLSKIQDPKFRFTPDAYAACQKEIESLPGLSRLSETEITKMVRDILDSALNGVKDLDEGFVPDGLQGISACLEALPLERIRTPALKREILLHLLNSGDVTVYRKLIEKFPNFSLENEEERFAMLHTVLKPLDRATFYPGISILRPKKIQNPDRIFELMKTLLDQTFPHRSSSDMDIADIASRFNLALLSEEQRKELTRLLTKSRGMSEKDIFFFLDSLEVSKIDDPTFHAETAKAFIDRRISEYLYRFPVPDSAVFPLLDQIYRWEFPPCFLPFPKSFDDRIENSSPSFRKELALYLASKSLQFPKEVLRPCKLQEFSDILFRKTFARTLAGGPTSSGDKYPILSLCGIEEIDDPEFHTDMAILLASRGSLYYLMNFPVPPKAMLIGMEKFPDYGSIPSFPESFVANVATLEESSRKEFLLCAAKKNLENPENFLRVCKGRELMNDPVFRKQFCYNLLESKTSSVLDFFERIGIFTDPDPEFHREAALRYASLKQRRGFDQYVFKAPVPEDAIVSILEKIGETHGSIPEFPPAFRERIAAFPEFLRKQLAQSLLEQKLESPLLALQPCITEPLTDPYFSGEFCEKIAEKAAQPQLTIRKVHEFFQILCPLDPKGVFRKEFVEECFTQHAIEPLSYFCDKLRSTPGFSEEERLKIGRRIIEEFSEIGAGTLCFLIERIPLEPKNTLFLLQKIQERFPRDRENLSESITNCIYKNLSYFRKEQPLLLEDSAYSAEDRKLLIKQVLTYRNPEIGRELLLTILKRQGDIEYQKAFLAICCDPKKKSLLAHKIMPGIILARWMEKAGISTPPRRNCFFFTGVSNRIA